tara:strand:+ start:96 stop:293 length:198 start_codon:yes stop_codon:yes gene_type:complete
MMNAVMDPGLLKHKTTRTTVFSRVTHRVQREPKSTKTVGGTKKGHVLLFHHQKQEPLVTLTVMEP